MQKGLHERAVQAAARAERPRAAQVHRVVGEMRGGQSRVLVVEGQDGRRLAVKLVQMTRG